MYIYWALINFIDNIGNTDNMGSTNYISNTGRRESNTKFPLRSNRIFPARGHVVWILYQHNSMTPLWSTSLTPCG